MTTEEQSPAGIRPMMVVLVALPLCLVVSIIGAVWFHWRSETAEEADPALALANEGMNRKEVDDLVRKFGWLNGEGWESEAGRKGIAQRIALIDGTLSPQNYGYIVERGAAVAHEGELWPMLWVDVEGGDRKSEVVVVATPYDFGDDDVVALLTAAKEWRDVGPQRAIRILFFPQWLFLENERRGDFFTSGEKMAAVLQLRQMGEAVEGGGSTLQVSGPELGPLEPALQMPGVERLVREAVGENSRIFGAGGAARHQTVRPVGAASRSKSEGRDLEALMGRTALLVEVATRLANQGE